MQNKSKFETWLHGLFTKGRNSAFTYYKSQEHRFHKDNYPSILAIIYGIDWNKASTNLLPAQFKTPLEFGTYLLSEWIYYLRKLRLTDQIPAQFLEALYQVEEEPLLTKRSPSELYSAVTTKVNENRKTREAEAAEVDRKLKEKIANEEYEAEFAKLVKEEETAKAAAAILENYEAKKPYTPKGKKKLPWEQKLVRLLAIATLEELSKAETFLKDEQTKRANKARIEAERRAKAEAKKREAEAKKKAAEEIRKKKVEAKIAELEAQKQALEKELAKLKK